ncbi:MAG: putative 4-hydroxybenzoate polyprenyltransferase [Actinobacteria bacterium]|nr:putative 4-hydroxybenzoate polyprenyltransferase [Actinomycetota bacterium]MCG2807216.1 putative 4-hydroxybenzoate polyprenyltransferase [Coriobacteriia bacterium]
MSKASSTNPTPGKVKLFLELVKFEHSIFALPYAYIGALYGAGQVTPGGWPRASELLWITLVMVGARAFAFVLNRAIDKEIDARNPRTAGRAIPAGLIKAWELWLFSALMLGIYLVGVWQLAPITRILWPIPLLAFMVYPYTKRFTPLCHYWLGLCLGLSAAGGWVAVGAPIGSPAPWVLGMAVMVWTAGFDIIYATQDVECDVRDGVHSMPADIGVPKALIQTRVTHALTVVLLALGGYLAGAGWPWYAGVGLAGALLWYENSIVSAEDLSRVNAAFFTVNGVIAVVVGAGAVLDRLIG